MEVFKNLNPRGSIETTNSDEGGTYFTVKIDSNFLVENGPRDGFYTFPPLTAASHTTTTDPTHEYSNEKDGFKYRTPNIENKELIALGCSQTYGMGVCEENTWPALLANKLNLSYANLAVPGTSIARNVVSFFSYIEKYEKPKAVAILLPDMYRMYIPAGSPHSWSDTIPKDRKIEMVNAIISKYAGTDQPWGRAVPSISKKPHKLEEVFYPEISYSQGFLMLNVLLVFCKYAGIYVVVDTWEREISHVLNSLDYLSEEVFSNAYRTHPEKNCLIHEKVKLDLKHDEFYHATDVTKNLSVDEEYQSHMGVHKHIHFAEAMAEKLKNQLID